MNFLYYILSAPFWFFGIYLIMLSVLGHPFVTRRGIRRYLHGMEAFISKMILFTIGWGILYFALYMVM